MPQVKTHTVTTGSGSFVAKCYMIQALCNLHFFLHYLGRSPFGNGTLFHVQVRHFKKEKTINTIKTSLKTLTMSQCCKKSSRVSPARVK